MDCSGGFLDCTGRLTENPPDETVLPLEVKTQSSDSKAPHTTTMAATTMPTMAPVPSTSAEGVKGAGKGMGALPGEITAGALRRPESMSVAFLVASPKRVASPSTACTLDTYALTDCCEFASISKLMPITVALKALTSVLTNRREVGDVMGTVFSSPCSSRESTPLVMLVTMLKASTCLAAATVMFTLKRTMNWREMEEEVGVGDDGADGDAVTTAAAAEGEPVSEAVGVPEAEAPEASGVLVGVMLAEGVTEGEDVTLGEGVTDTL